MLICTKLLFPPPPLSLLLIFLSYKKEANKRHSSFFGLEGMFFFAVVLKSVTDGVRQ